VVGGVRRRSQKIEEKIEVEWKEEEATSIVAPLLVFSFLVASSFDGRFVP